MNTVRAPARGDASFGISVVAIAFAGCAVGATQPVGAAPLGSVVEVSAGVYHACAALADGTAECWGRNDGGEIGDGTVTSRSLPVPVENASGSAPLTGITQIATGATSCALLTDTTVRCWGDNFAGELGIGTNSGPETCNGEPCSTLPVEVKNPAGTGPLTGVAQISVGDGDVCALLQDTSATCWGSNSFGELADGHGLDSSLPSPVVTDDALDPLTGITAISAGEGHTCATVTGGTARCWGDNQFGELGDGTKVGGFVEVKNGAGTGPLTSIASITAGYRYTCAVLGDHSVDCWGYNAFGELGDGTALDRCLPATVGTVGPSASAPAAPTGVTATGGVDQATIHWAQETGDCGTPVTKFVVTASPGGQKITVDGWHNATWTTSAVFALKPGPAYSFTVAATDDAGSSARSSPSNAVKPVGEPSAPVAPTASPGNARATISWTKPALTNGAAISGYSVTPLRNGVPDSPKVFHSTATGEVFTGLKNNVTYTFKVAAINVYGTGAPSKPTGPIRVGSPAAPTSVKAIGKKGSGALVVIYTAGANNGAPITRFTATCTSPNGGVAKSGVHPGATAKPILLAGLTANKTYACTVNATNSRGAGPQSAPTAKVSV